MALAGNYSISLPSLFRKLGSSSRSAQKFTSKFFSFFGCRSGAVVGAADFVGAAS